MTNARSIYLDHEYICKYSTNTIIWIYDIPGSVDNFNGLIMNTYFKHRSPFGKPGRCCRPALGVSEQQRTHTHTHLRTM